MSTPKSTLILIVGPTAVGKTEVAIQVAGRMHGEIISADSRLFYRGMDIGIAKPTRREIARVPHHLINITDPDQTLSLSVFQKMTLTSIADIQARGKLPFLVGGTGQYLRAVTKGWLPPEVKPNPKLRDELEKIALRHHPIAGSDVQAMSTIDGKEWLYQRLRSLDPEAAEKMDARNLRRTVRAMEVILTTGRKFSDQRGKSESPYDLITIGLTRPRTELYSRIDARIEEMFEAGLLDEVRGLLNKGYSPDLPAMSAIGYRESIRVIRGIWSVEEAKVAMRRATRAYVRRQSNWFKDTDPDIKWFKVQTGVDEKIEQFIRAHLTL